MSYCYFIVHVQIEPKLTMGGILSFATAIRRYGVQKDQFIFIFLFI